MAEVSVRARVSRKTGAAVVLRADADLVAAAGDFANPIVAYPDAGAVVQSSPVTWAGPTLGSPR